MPWQQDGPSRRAGPYVSCADDPPSSTVPGRPGDGRDADAADRVRAAVDGSVPAVLPELARDLEAPASAAQLTVTACLIGLASGQLVAGPLSDRFGRRRPLIVGILAYIAASVLCAFSPGMITLVLARFAQGLAGATGLVIAQASGRDVYEGGALIAFYARLTGLGGFAAIVGPLLGGQAHV